MLNSFMVIAYILYCLRFATRPCKHFQLNARFFDRSEGIFSKIRTDRLIPGEWHLPQWVDDGAQSPEREPDSYPVFIKPEWSQNARGVHRADNAGELRRLREQTAAAGIRYLIQQGAVEANEYEIYTIRHHRDRRRYAVFNVACARNRREQNPVNGIYNPDTRYLDITDSFPPAAREKIWGMVNRIGEFAVSRLSVRADCADDLARGKFHIIEVNLFLPMPIHLLDRNHSRARVCKQAAATMRALALATKHRDRSVADAPVFVKSMLYNRRGVVAGFIRLVLARV